MDEGYATCAICKGSRSYMLKLNMLVCVTCCARVRSSKVVKNNSDIKDILESISAITHNDFGLYDKMIIFIYEDMLTAEEKEYVRTSSYSL